MKNMNIFKLVTFTSFVFFFANAQAQNDSVPPPTTEQAKVMLIDFFEGVENAHNNTFIINTPLETNIDGVAISVPQNVKIDLRGPVCGTYKSALKKMQTSTAKKLDTSFFQDIGIDESVYNPYIQFFHQVMEQPKYAVIRQDSTAYAQAEGTVYGSLQDLVVKMVEKCDSDPYNKEHGF